MSGKSIKLLLSTPGITFRGFESGFNERADVVYATKDGTDLNAMFNEIQEILNRWNNWRDSLLSRLVFETDKTVETVGVPGTQVNFERATEYGQPVGIRGGTKRHRGYTFQFYDLAQRYTWMFLAEAERQQIQALTNQALEADNRLVFNLVLNALFDPTNLVGSADSNIPTTVYKLWNADGEVPPVYKNTVHNGSHTHFLTSGGATVTSANLDTMAGHLTHHGHGPLDGSTLILLVNEAEGATIRGFSRTGGAKYDFIPSSNYGGGVFVPFNGGIVARPQGEVKGEIGTYGPWHVVEENYVPVGYMIGLASGGEFNVDNPIGIRVHTNPVFRGLKLIPGQERVYPLVDSFYRHGLGVGVRQRGAGVIMQVTAGAYAVPAAYATAP